MNKKDITLKYLRDKISNEGLESLTGDEARALGAFKALSKKSKKSKSGQPQERSIEQQDKRTNSRAKSKRDMTESIRNIGPIPPIENWERRDSCSRDLQRFIETYAMEGKWPFSEDHVRVIGKMQNCILYGGKFIEAVYRGFGKSTLTELAGLWAVLYGHKHYMPIVTATTPKGKEVICDVKILLELPMIAADFPEVCFPIVCLEGVNQRASNQLYTDPSGNVLTTHLKYSDNMILLPNTEGAFDTEEPPVFHPNLAKFSKIESHGITSKAIRGLKHMLLDASVIRPDFCIIDDPQDQESCHSPVQVAKRLEIIQKSILKSAGHVKEISVIMPCTVLAKNDMIDQMMNRKNFPSWQTERIPFVTAWAENHEIWLGEYARIRNDFDDQLEGDFQRARKDASDYYLANRDAMDKGCVVSWQHCFYEAEHSAIQHAYNFLIDDGEEVFQSELQNNPMDQILDDDEMQLTREHVEAKFNGEKKLEIPDNIEKLTAFIDVQGKSLYWMICAWGMDYTGNIIDYGVFPEQTKSVFKASEVSPTLFDKYPGLGQEGVWYKAFTELCNRIIERRYLRIDGTEMSISRLLLDANEGQSVDTISNYCRLSQHKAIVMPQRGRGITASSLPFDEYKRKKGDRIGSHWRIPSTKGQAMKTRFILSDTNWFKSFARERLKQGLGDTGSVSIFGTSKRQQMLIDHLLSEYSILTSGRGRDLYEWKPRPSYTENHWWDCFVGNCVAASEQGVVLESLHAGKTVRERKNADPKERLSRLGKVRG